MKQVSVSVINDLVTDQRVHKVCTSLQNMGFVVTAIGRKQRASLPLEGRSYKVVRMPLLFEKGPAFYAFFQLRLFFHLLFHRADVLVANDLDTLLPNYLVSRLKRIPLVYDSHELFCEVPELQQNPLKRKIWKSVERRIFPKLKQVMTVNESIAKIYQDEYGVKVNVLRNIPLLRKQTSGIQNEEVPAHGKKIIILQGAGINMDRGAEEAVLAMQYVEDAILLIVGSGDVIEELKKMRVSYGLEEKVIITGKVPFDRLVNYTKQASIGLTLDKDTNINYRYSLPNKIFDYIHAGVPVLASDLVEIRKIIEEYNVGMIVNSHDPKMIAEAIKKMLGDEALLREWKKNANIAAETLNWQAEEQVLKSVYRPFLAD